MFTHEKFKAYQQAIKFAEMAIVIIDQIPASHSSLKDQLRRAAFSISLNIAEGTGKTGQADRKRFYSIARGSAMECAAICDIVNLADSRLGGITLEAKQLLQSIVNILTTVCAK